MSDDDHAHLMRMDAHVRAIMAGANPRLLALNTALGHTTTSTPLRYEAISQAMEGSSTTPYEPRDSRVEDPPLSPLTLERINAEIAECYAYYYAETSSEDECPVDPMSERRPSTPYHVPDTPPSDSPSTHTTHDDTTYALSTTSLVLSRPSLPTPIMPTLEESSSSTTAGTHQPSPHRPRTLFRATEEDASATRRNAATYARESPPTTRYGRPPPAVTITETPPHWEQGPIQLAPAPQPIAAFDAAPPQWGHGPLHFEPASHVPWQAFQWNDEHPHGPEPEPQPWATRPHDASPDSVQEEDEFPLSSYVQTRSSFQGGTTVNATGFVRDPLNTHHPLSTRPLTICLDSYSDVTVAHRDIVYGVRPIHESLTTGGENTDYHEEGLVDIVDGPCAFRTIPALVASDPAHLPTKCLLLMGVPQLNELNIKLDTHRKARRLPLESYDPSIDFSADTHLQCRMSEKNLLTWAEHNKETTVGYTMYSHLDVIYAIDTLSLDELRQLRAASNKYQSVYNAAKGALPALTNHPPVTLNFKEG
jgi:hypothetical protein